MRGRRVLAKVTLLTSYSSRRRVPAGGALRSARPSDHSLSPPTVGSTAGLPFDGLLVFERRGCPLSSGQEDWRGLLRGDFRGDKLVEQPAGGHQIRTLSTAPSIISGRRDCSRHTRRPSTDMRACGRNLERATPRNCETNTERIKFLLAAVSISGTTFQRRPAILIPS